MQRAAVYSRAREELESMKGDVLYSHRTKTIGT